MTSPNQVIELMMKEAGIANLDMIVEEAYKLKEAGKKYYLDISGKVRETGMSRTILSPVVSLICCTSKRQEELLMFLSKEEETTKDYLVRQFGAAAYSVTVLTLNALGMVNIENRYSHKKNGRDYFRTRHISVVKPNHQKIKKFWIDLFPEVQQRKEQHKISNVRPSLHPRKSSEPIRRIRK